MKRILFICVETLEEARWLKLISRRDQIMVFQF